MARSILYRLVHTQTGTIAGATSLQVIRNCRAYAIQFSTALTGGAGAGRLSQTVELNNTAQANGDTNNAPREVILAGHVVQTVTSSSSGATCSGTSPVYDIDVPLKPGDILSANQVQTGTAPAAANTVISIFCRE